MKDLLFKYLTVVSTGLFTFKPFSNLDFLYETIGCSLAYQVQDRNAKLLGNILLLLRRDSSYFSGGLVHIAKFGMLFEYCSISVCANISSSLFFCSIEKWHGDSMHLRMFSQKSCLEEDTQLFEQVTCKHVLPVIKYKPQQQQHTILVQLYEVSGAIQWATPNIQHDKLNVLGYSSERLVYQFNFSSGMMKVLSRALVQGEKKGVS